MVWTDLDQFKVNQLVDATALDAIRGNIEYLHSPNMDYYQHPGTGGDYTNTGTLGDDIDSTNFKLSITTYGGLILAGFYGVFSATSGSIRTNIVRTDNVSHIGVNLYYNYTGEVWQVSAARRGIGWIQRFANVPAGTHEFRAIWGVSGATATLHVAHRPYMWVIEK